jgi:hypothetical protein
MSVYKLPERRGGSLRPITGPNVEIQSVRTLIHESDIDFRGVSGSWIR